MSTLPKRLCVAVSAALLTLSGAASAQNTLQEVVEHTLQTNPDVLIDVARRLAAAEGISSARGNYLPKIDLQLGIGKAKTDKPSNRDAGLSAGWNNRKERQITLTQLLFDGFATPSEVSRNAAIAEAAGYQLAGTSDQVALAAIEAYLEILRLREVLMLTEDALDAHERIYDQIRMRADGGISRRSDQDQIEARLALAKANNAAAQANLREAEANYLLVVGQRAEGLSRPQAPEDGLLPEGVEDAVLIALENHPVLRSALADVRQAEAQRSGVASSLYPRLDLELGHSRDDGIDGDPRTTKNTYGMVRLRYNLFNGTSDLSRDRRAQQQVFEATEIMHRTRRQVEQSTLLSWNALQSAQERLPALRQHADSSSLTRDAYRQQFSLGQRTLLDLLDSENEYFTAATNALNGEFIENFGRYRVLADLGQLLPALGIEHHEAALFVAYEPPVQTPPQE